MAFEPASPNPQPFSAGVHLRPSFDVVEVLPAGAADRLRHLRQHAADQHALTVPFADIQEANNAKVAAEQRLRQLTAHPQDGGFNLPVADRRVIEQQKLVDKATDDLRRLNDRNEARTAAWTAASGALQAVETWLRDGRPQGTVLEDHSGPEPQLLKGEDLMGGISRLQRRGRELKADLHRIRSAPYPSAHARAKIRQEVEALALAGAPVLSDVIEHDRSVIWPSQRVQSEVLNIEGRGISFHEVTDALALTCWLHKDALIAALDREIATESDDKAALTQDARAKAEAEVLGDMLAVERDEAALVWRAMGERLPVEHRADCSAQAILQIGLVAAAGNGHAGPSSWQHAWDIVGGR